MVREHTFRIPTGHDATVSLAVQIIQGRPDSGRVLVSALLITAMIPQADEAAKACYEEMRLDKIGFVYP